MRMKFVDGICGGHDGQQRSNNAACWAAAAAAAAAGAEAAVVESAEVPAPVVIVGLEMIFLADDDRHCVGSIVPRTTA